MKAQAFFFTITFCTAVLGSENYGSSKDAFPWQEVAALEWRSEFNGASDFQSTSALPATAVTHWGSNIQRVIIRVEKHLLDLYTFDSTIGIAEQVYSHCQSLENLSNQILQDLAGPEWEPARQQIEQAVKKQSQVLNSELKLLSTENLKSQAALLLKKLQKLTTDFQDIALMVENRFSPLEPHYRPELLNIANPLDELTVGRLVGEGIAKKVEEMVIGGDLHGSINEIANIFCDFGTLITAYATGLAICTSGVAVVLCGISILVCGGGTVIYVCRLLQHLKDIYKVLAYPGS
ncbi:LANO_0F01442g1_1 [Lachancea nothofagi CBS 11611]|uniref:LANO_0F01442g1_1 n=1 Tax=Lachancea nothofagi CBS 11611 TaxID=1266666 RepID=A0A1G4K651_9SACH|nr:LANO_0F01442g1_1 [Lachancea nothofagi CBS 11611]